MKPPKSPKRGRPRLGKKAMSGAQRQARYRVRRRKQLAEEQLLRGRIKRWPSGKAYPVAPGYQLAKDRLIDLGHHFERARREWGFEAGIFVDGAFMNSYEVVALAALSKLERSRRLEESRRKWKHMALHAVESYMAGLQVSGEELANYMSEGTSQTKPQQVGRLLDDDLHW